IHGHYVPHKKAQSLSAALERVSLCSEYLFVIKSEMRRSVDEP
ncbi:jg25650, partial [Pararge aegeria aegeria]